jgi:hypothetical protein
MTAGSGATRFASLSRRQAVGVLALWLAVTGWLLAGIASLPGADAGAPAAGGQQSDVALYKAIVARVRAGAGYYDAAAVELRARRYPMRSPLNWRSPVYAWLLARLPDPLVGSALLVGLAAGVVASAVRWVNETNLARRWRVALAVTVVAMSGCLVRDFVYLQEAWAGGFIALAVCLHARGSWRGALAASLAALAFRELALVPFAVGLALAARRRRWPEVVASVAALAVWAALMAWHAAEVARRLSPDDLGRASFGAGGAAFVLAACQWSPLLIALPRWLAAVAVPVIFVGLCGWRPAERAALIVGGYVLLFAFVGHGFNDYWGAIFTPLLAFGVLSAPAAVRDLARAACGPRLAAPEAR